MDLLFHIQFGSKNQHAWTWKNTLVAKHIIACLKSESSVSDEIWVFNKFRYYF